MFSSSPPVFLVATGIQSPFPIQLVSCQQECSGWEVGLSTRSALVRITVLAHHQGSGFPLRRERRGGGRVHARRWNCPIFIITVRGVGIQMDSRFPLRRELPWPRLGHLCVRILAIFMAMAGGVNGNRMALRAGRIRLTASWGNTRIRTHQAESVRSCASLFSSPNPDSARQPSPESLTPTATGG